MGPGPAAPVTGDGRPEAAVPVGERQGVGRTERLDGGTWPAGGGDGVDAWGPTAAGDGLAPAMGVGTGAPKAGGGSIVAQLASVSVDGQLRAMAERTLGETSFGVGVLVGMAKNPIDGVVGLLELQKTFVLADLYDKMSEPLSWKTVLDTLAGPGTAVKLGAAALVQLGVLDMEDLRKAHEQREALVRQLGEVLSSPLEYLSELPGQLRDEYVGKWNQFRELSQQPDPKSQYEAGKILGDLLMEVATSVAGLLTGAGTAAKLAAKAPQLIKLGRVLDKVDGPGPDGVPGRTKLRVPEADARALADRKKINELSQAGKIAEARDLLRPYLDAARAAKTPAEKSAALDAIVSRLDVGSSQPKMFWSGNREAAARIAESRGATVMEGTPGGRVIDGWNEIGQAFKWDDGNPPWGAQFWGKLSAKYASDVKGTIEVIQTGDRFPQGGNIFRDHEWPKIYGQATRGEVKELVLNRIDDKGRLVETRRIDPLSEEATALFGAPR